MTWSLVLLIWILVEFFVSCFKYSHKSVFDRILDIGILTFNCIPINTSRTNFYLWIMNKLLSGDIRLL